MPIQILLLFLLGAFTGDIVEANRVHRKQGDIDDLGPVFPHEAFGVGYEDFINRIHPPLMAAMNYRPVMPHDIPQSASDGKIKSVALSLNSDAAAEPNEEETRSETFTSSTLEVLPTPVAEQMLESISSPTPELEASTGESSTKTIEAATETEESTEEIYVEPENVSESNSEAETPEYQVDKPSTLSEYSIFKSGKDDQTLDREDTSEKLSDSRDKPKDSVEKELADALKDKASAAVYESEVSDPNESESSKLKTTHETQEIPHISSESFVAKQSDSKSSSSSDDDYYYYVPDYKYTKSEVFDEVSDDELTTSSYDYSDSTYEYSDSTYEYSDTTSEYYSTDLVESEQKVIVFPEPHGTQDSRQSFTKESESGKTTLSDISRKQESSPSESSETRSVMKDNNEELKSSKDESSKHIVKEGSKVEHDSDSEDSRLTQVSSDLESKTTSSSSSKKAQDESDSGKTTSSSSKEAAVSTAFPMSSKSSEQSEELVNIPHIMEDLMVLKEAAKVYGQKLDFESMRKIVEQAITELSSIRKRLTKKEYVLDDLNQVIDELQKLCQAICANVPEKYLMPEPASKSISAKSKRH